MSMFDEAFSKLFPDEKPELCPREEKLNRVINKFDISVLGEESALKILCSACLYSHFPNRSKNIKTAKSKIAQILGLEIEKRELALDEIAHIQVFLDRGESVKEIRSRF